MTWSDLPKNPSAKILRQFAAAWLVFFGLIAARQYFHYHHQQAGITVAAIAIVFGISGLIKPTIVKWIFVSWMTLAFPIGWLISQIVLALMVFLILTPMASLLRLKGRDPLLRKPPANRSTFWLAKQTPADVRSYFRQH